MKENINIVNRSARFEYEFIDTYSAGIMLTGVEVKFIRDGKLSFVDSFCSIQNGELFMKNVSISGIGNDDIKRDRKLLLKKKEINKILKNLDKGLTIVPIRIYTNERRVFKVDIALARGKKLHDKRDSIKKRDMDREINKILKK